MDACAQRQILSATAAGFIMLLVGLIMVGMVPPPSPENSPEWWLQFWGDSVNLKRTGLILALLGASCAPGLVVVLFQQMRRVLGRESTVAYVQLAAGMLAVLVFLMPPLFIWSALTYRPGQHDPDLALALTDLSMFPFLFAWLGVVQFIMIAICAFRDSAGILFPRWMGYLVLWCAVAFVPGSFIYFFKSGPIAWNGIISFWVGLAGVVIGTTAIILFLLRALRRQQLEEQLG